VTKSIKIIKIPLKWKVVVEIIEALCPKTSLPRAPGERR
jgi:hypothetical protein